MSGDAGQRDPRLTPANGRVAHETLRDVIPARRYTKGVWRQLRVPLTDLRAAPEGARVRQLLMGEAFLMLERRAGRVFGQAARDGHVGWIAAEALGEPDAPTHWVSAPSTHLYAAPEIRAHTLAGLSLGARLHVVGQAGAMARTAQGGFVPRVHLRPIGDWARDPVAVAESLIGTPYLWGGNSRAGLDCSALVQMALLACGHACPPDSDLQQAGLGRALAPEAWLRRGDLVFWRGHVGWMTDAEGLLHANAHHMAVVREPLAEAAARIAEGGEGAILVRRRLGH